MVRCADEATVEACLRRIEWGNGAGKVAIESRQVQIRSSDCLVGKLETYDSRRDAVYKPQVTTAAVRKVKVCTQLWRSPLAR